MSEGARKFEVEEVDGVAPPPRARVGDSDAVDTTPADAAIAEAAPEPAEAPAPRQKDYLTGFLQQTAPDLSDGEPGGALYEAVINALKEIFDPEIPVNIYDLGLIYGVDITDDSDVAITMTLTTPHCPVAESMPGEVEMRASAVPGVRDAQVNLVWDPPWDPAKMSDEARLELGML